MNNLEDVNVSIKWANLFFHTFIKHHYGVNISLRTPYARSIFSIFALCMESNDLDKSTNSSVASKLFARTPSTNKRIVRISDVMDQF